VSENDDYIERLGWVNSDAVEHELPDISDFINGSGAVAARVLLDLIVDLGGRFFHFENGVGQSATFAIMNFAEERGIDLNEALHEV